MLNQQLRALPLGLSCVGRNRIGVHRFLFIFVTLAILVTLYHTSFLRLVTFSVGWTPSSRRTGSQINALEPLKTNSRFISWLSARVPVDRVPFITIGDCQYIHALRNFRDRLDQWGYGDDLVVICLDQCCADARDYHAYNRYIGESVAFVKVRANTLIILEVCLIVLVFCQFRSYHERLQFRVLRWRRVLDRRH
jgi:hypothetical protein